MSQTNLFINPSADNGIDLANKLNAWREAIHSSHKGLDRPQYAEPGMFWVCEKSESLWQWYLYDGNQDILVCNFNPIDSTIAVSGANSISIEEVPPANPKPGDLWYESDSGKLYISYINPEDSVQSWVSTGGNGGGGGDSSSTSYSVPVGTIAMWSGPEDEVHPNWAICNGENGTPDLRDRFIVGSGLFYQNGQTGGRSSVQLTVDEMPYHTHTASTKASRMTGTTSAGGGHSHTVNDPGHAHYMGRIIGRDGGLQFNGGAGVGDFRPNTDPAGTGISIAGAPDHTHTFSVDITGGGVNISGTGGGQAFDITPKFYALCYVMKIVPDGAEIGDQQLGTMAIQNKNEVEITGGSISGITPLAVADGGLGAASHPANSLIVGMGSSSPEYIAPGADRSLLISEGGVWKTGSIDSVMSSKSGAGDLGNGSVFEVVTGSSGVVMITVQFYAHANTGNFGDSTGSIAIDGATVLSQGAGTIEYSSRNSGCGGVLLYKHTAAPNTSVAVTFNWGGPGYLANARFSYIGL